MPLLVRSALLLLVLAGPPGAYAQTALPHRATARIDSLFADVARPESPGYAVGVVREGRLVFEKGYGSADLDHGVPISARSAFHIASLSKQFTAGAVALLVLDGDLALDAPVSDYLPGTAKYGRGLRIEHLLYMTSGLHEYTSQPRASGLPWQTFYHFTTEEAIEAALRPDTLRFAPGSRWEYSNTNYMLLAQVVERVSGRRLETFLHDRVFGPLGMTATHVNDDPTLVVPDRATGYLRRSPELTEQARALGLYVRDEPGWLRLPRISPHYGGSGVVSTVEDLARWTTSFDDARLAGPAFVRLMEQRQPFDHDKDNDALGLYWSTFDERPMLAYDGSDVDGSSYMARFPDQHVAVIVLSNISSENASERARRLMEILVESGVL